VGIWVGIYFIVLMLLTGKSFAAGPPRLRRKIQLRFHVFAKTQEEDHPINLPKANLLLHFFGFLKVEAEIRSTAQAFPQIDGMFTACKQVIAQDMQPTRARSVCKIEVPKFKSMQLI
jgi:hypothetical protein